MKALFILMALAMVACTSNPTREPAQPTEVLPEVPVQVFKSKSSLTWVHNLEDKANCTIWKKGFQDDVKAIKNFYLDPTKSTGAQVLEKLKKGSCTIRTYRTKNPWSKAIATTWSSDRVNFYLNLRKNPRSMPSMINTAVHECLHLLGYSHGNNSSVGKQNTVNYKIGKIAQNHACN